MKKAILFIMLLLSLQGCKIYSFTGANIDPNIKTVSVEYINNKSGNGPTSASDIITNMLKEKMVINTNLAMVNAGGDVQFSGAITSYRYSIQAPSGNTSSDLRRVTITVTVSYYNKVNEAEGFEQQQFTRFADYPVDQDLNTIEDEIIRSIGELLVDDIFNKAFVNW